MGIWGGMGKGGGNEDAGGMGESGNRKGADNKIKRTPHSREGGNLPVVEAGRATRATLRFVICDDGAGIGKFPTAREGGIL